jgi:hypothetical protein
MNPAAPFLGIALVPQARTLLLKEGRERNASLFRKKRPEGKLAQSRSWWNGGSLPSNVSPLESTDYAFFSFAPEPQESSIQRAYGGAGSG